MICDLIIPAFNEAENVPALLEALGPHRTGALRHVVLADNGSTDETAARAAAAGAVVVHEPRRGYGAACLRALAWIERLDEPPEVVVFLDADLSDDPAVLPELLGPIERDGCDLVIGARRRRAEPGALNPVQRFGNALACRMMRTLAGARFTDLGPFRAVRWTALQRLSMEDRTWGWTVEMQMKAALIGLRSCEVDVPYRRRRAGRSKISGTVRGVVAAGTKIIATILRLWLGRRRLRQTAGMPSMPGSST